MTDAPDRIWAWVWRLPVASKSNGKREWADGKPVFTAAHGETTPAEYIRLDLHEAAVAAARAEGMREAAAVLQAKHEAWAKSKGRDPEDYSSAFDLAARVLRSEASK